MRAGAACETRIEFQHDGVGLTGRLTAGADPQAPAESHGSEVLEPFAFPDAILDYFDPDRFGRQRQYRHQGRRDDAGIRIGRIQRAQP